jgi:hypothetical protein
MPLSDIDEKGNARAVNQLPYQAEFDRVWLKMSLPQRRQMEAEINHRLDELLDAPDAKWGSITNTSIEGGKSSPLTGKRGDWSGTVFQPIFEACGRSEERAAMFFGNLWKMVIMSRPERWIGYRPDPNFPQRGITLEGKTYFVATE